MSSDRLLLATRKGLIVCTKDSGKWQFSEPHFSGIPVSLTGIDRVSGNWWVMLDHGHWGCKLHYSSDEGKSWNEVEAPKYPEGEEIKPGSPATLQYLWGFAFHATQQGSRIYLGTDPGGLFSGDANGSDFKLNSALWNRPERQELWFGGGRDNPGIHSILVDPVNPDHLYVAISCAGVFESTDGGESWLPRNKGLRADYLPNPDAEIGHDVHLLAASADDFSILWQQNHFGIYRSTDAGLSWHDVSEEEGPARFGFTIAVDENNSDIAWVIPASSDENRVAYNNALQVCRTDNGGGSWQTFTSGLPQEHCYDLVYRHALTVQNDTLCFGSTTGNVFLSEDRGENWSCLHSFLPPVYACEFV